jgi:hypothetical protein
VIFERSIRKMKKITIMMIMAFAILLAYTSMASAAEILGYPIVAKQAKFYTMILGLMGASMALVGGVYGYMWLADLKNRNPGFLKNAIPKETRSMLGKLTVQAAK